VVQMQAAKKLALVDPVLLEQLKSDRHYKEIQKPLQAVTKSGLSRNIGDILDDGTYTDDQKVKHYLEALRRFVNVRDKVPEEPTIQFNPITELDEKKPKTETLRKTKTPASKRPKRKKKPTRWLNY